MGRLIRYKIHLRPETKKLLADAESGALLRHVSRQLAEEALDLVKETFETSRDPYGEAWKPTLRSTWGGAILQQTGRLKASWSLQEVTSKGFTIGTAAAYAKFHQEGTGVFGPTGQRIKPTTKKALSFVAGGMMFVQASVAGAPKRKMVPDQGHLPNAWRTRLKTAAEDAVRILLFGD